MKFPTGMLGEMLLAILGILFHLHGTLGQFESDFTLQNVWGRLQTEHRSIIQCLSDETYKGIKFSRKLDTGQGMKLPKSSHQFLQGKPISARILLMPVEDKQDRFGVYKCRIVKNKITTEIVTLKLPPLNIVQLDALNPYNVASIGDKVQLEVNITRKLELPIRWRHNGVDIPDWNDQLTVEIPNVQSSDSGIYECFYEGKRSEGAHALMRLIVRECQPDLYGPACDQECPLCYNGGICHDKWGECVCPAGFTGFNCEIACGGNHFGANCSKTCTVPGNNSNPDELCASHLFCKPDPYGCSCAPGFKGAICMEHCEPGWYGADCKQPCHCAYGISSCNRITGACDGGCAPGWSGNSCQIEDPNATNSYVETTTLVYCDPGSYGPSCERVCRCAGGEHCNVITGHCPSGCEEGWGGQTCGECIPGRFGPNCASTCHCHENSTCDKISGMCETNCEAGYMGQDCKTICPPTRYGVNCKDECVCENGGHCNPVDGTCSCDGRWKGHFCNESDPQIIAFTDEEVNKDEQVFLSCIVEAVPQPTISIASNNHSDLHIKNCSLGENQYQAIVRVKPTEAGRFEFNCTARNQHGFDMKKMTLTVTVPGEPSEVPVMDAGQTFLNLTWKKPANSVITGYKITYKPIVTLDSVFNSTPFIEAEIEVDDVKNQVIALTEVHPSTRYSLSVSSRRSAGYGPNVSLKSWTVIQVSLTWRD